MPGRGGQKRRFGRELVEKEVLSQYCRSREMFGRQCIVGNGLQEAPDVNGLWYMCCNSVTTVQCDVESVVEVYPVGCCSM
jgi:hypothetical protein